MTKSDDEVVSEPDDLEMMKRPHLWPLDGYLPIKRYVESDHGRLELETAILVRIIVNGQLTVLKGFFEDRDTDRVLYDSHEAIVAEGWVVD